MSVESKLLEAMKLVSELPPDKKMSQEAGGYWYLSEDRVTSVLHPIFVATGLTIAPVRMAILSERSIGPENKLSHSVRIGATYRISDAEEPTSHIDVEVVGEGMDNRDKAVSKAVTSCYKTALLQTLMISTGGGDDQGQSRDTQKGQASYSCPCGAEVSKGAATYSQQHYGEVLCQACQKKRKE